MRGSTPNDTLDVALEVAAAIEAVGGEYFVGGSVATSFQGEPRTTNDVDSILRKLLWFRDGGEISDRQWRDVLSVLRIRGATLEEEYLGDWARRLKVDDLLLRARAELSRTR
jgi:hypothetical protein